MAYIQWLGSSRFELVIRLLLTVGETTNGIREYAINARFEIENKQWGIIRSSTANRRPTTFNLSPVWHFIFKDMWDMIIYFIQTTAGQSDNNSHKSEHETATTLPEWQTNLPTCSSERRSSNKSNFGAFCGSVHVLGDDTGQAVTEGSETLTGEVSKWPWHPRTTES